MPAIIDLEAEVFYKPEDVAKRLSISKTLVYDMISEGEIPHIRWRKVIRVPKSQLENLIANRLKGQ